MLIFVTYSIALNGAVVGKVHPHRGICQGDPLLPYLFMLVSQGLSALITDAMHMNKFLGLKVANASPVASHLFFADDRLLFFKVKTTDALKVRGCLRLYEQASGQVINYEKSALTFSPSTFIEDMEAVKSIFQISVVTGHELYLGLPTFSL